MDSAEQSEQSSEQTTKNISRRGFLVGAGALLASALGKQLMHGPTQDRATTPDPTRPPPPTGNVLDRNGYYMKSTVIAETKLKKDNTFTPEFGYTEKMFKDVRRGVYVMEYFIDPRVSRGARGTGSIIDISPDGKTVIYLTADHVALPNDSIPLTAKPLPQDQIPVSIFLPGKTEKIPLLAPPRTKQAKGGPGLGYKLALVEAKLREPLQDPYVIPIDDNPVLHLGEQLWSIGYPIDMQLNDINSTNYILSSNYIELTHQDIESKAITGPAISGKGASGSPIMALRNGIPKIIGVFTDTDVEELPGPIPVMPGTPEPKTIMGRSLMQGHSLTQIHEMLADLKSTQQT